MTKQNFSYIIVTDKVIDVTYMRIMKKTLHFALFLQFLLYSNLFSASYYVSLSGNDSFRGTIDSSFATLTKAISIMQAGDTTYIRGGIYSISTNIAISKIGRSNLKFHLFGFPNERPLLDFSSQSFGTRGISLSGYYWYIKGIDIKGAGDNGLFISGSFNTIEHCTFFENRDSGLQLSNGASNNQVINCDSYYNHDPDPNPTKDGADADGFAPKLTVGTNNYFYGCRAWQNTDDGWDCYEAVAAVTIENCWTFGNGYTKDWIDLGAQANGNGFKVGGNYTENDATVKNCLAFGNKAKGFDQNHNKGSMTFFNCTGYSNGGNNYSVSEALNTGKSLTIANCIELGNKISIGAFAIQNTNSWLSPFTGATNSDFISIDTTGVRNPRKPDGSLPDVDFMHLSSGSQFINSGTDIGLPFNESKPDLGCFETGIPSVYVDKLEEVGIKKFELYQNYPNPFNPTTVIEFQILLSSFSQKGDGGGFISLKVYDLLGREVAVLVNEQKPAGSYSITWDASNMTNGVYFYSMQAGNFVQTRKLLLLK